MLGPLRTHALELNCPSCKNPLPLSEEFSFTKDIIIPITEYDNWLKRALFQKSEIKKLMVLKEVLGEPRSLKPFAGEY